METVFAQLSEDAKDFWAPRSVARIPPPSPLVFYRDYVSKNIPVIITGGIDHWPAMRKWTDDYLLQTIGNKTVTVDVTPSGYGDAVLALDATTKVFVQPEERDVTFREFHTLYHDAAFDGIPYLSHQNDSLRDQFPQLVGDVDAAIGFAAEAFGNTPEAVNLWIGDERAVSTMHKDHYENMYCVVRGRKHFTLLPPSDVAFLHETTYPTTRYVHESRTARFDAAALRPSTHPSWFVHVPVEAAESTPWIPVDPLNVDAAQFPNAKHIAPLEVVLEAGEMLYLPSLWYHRATQLCDTVAVNYWHDMEFDAKYVYFNFVHGVATAAKELRLKTHSLSCLAPARVHQAVAAARGPAPRTPPVPAESLLGAVRSASAVEPAWNTTPPAPTRILKHQLLCRSLPPSAAAQALAPSQTPLCLRKGEAPKATKASLLALRRQVEMRLAQDRNEERREANEWWWPPA
ncbi:hypothetical protein ACHHYP_01804 [Achlya hypogyna]|uniref:JmjC domain-containing protein n=1 Tax=Achlya hypogyna TaxID=1202772 RepID=A0A1V9ZSZ4_ACHHY|nr:hypothetical protein ACHHYP_01804 [Achlya hypogyna]